VIEKLVILVTVSQTPASQGMQANKLYLLLYSIALRIVLLPTTRNRCESGLRWIGSIVIMTGCMYCGWTHFHYPTFWYWTCSIFKMH